MKKVLFGMALVFCSSISILSGQNINTPAKTEQLTAMKDVKFWFCNEGLDNTTTTLNSAIDQWTPFKVCAVWQNNGPTDVKVHVDLADITKTQQWSKACGLTTEFEQFVNPKDLKQLKDFVLPAGNNVIKEFDVTFPIWIDGQQWWCFAYSVSQANKEQAMLWVVIRSATWMDFFVGSLENIKNEFKTENTTTSLDWNKDLIMKFDLVNIWNLENDIVMTWNITNMFWFSKSVSVDVWKMTPGMTKPIEMNLWSIPSYGWLFNINLNLSAKPYFSYDISNSSIDPTLLETKTITIKNTFFQIPRLIIWGALLIIILLVLVFKKKKPQVVYIQQPQQVSPA